MRDEPRMLPPWAMMPSVSATVEGARHVLDQAAPAFEDADADAPSLASCCTTARITAFKPGTVTAAGEQTDLHGIVPRKVESLARLVAKLKPARVLKPNRHGRSTQVVSTLARR